MLLGTLIPLFFLTCVPSPCSLQMVFCFSPVGHTLRVRARKFPAIVNCTTIDWFHEWPQEALVSVSRRFIEEIEGIEVSCVSRGRYPAWVSHFQFHNLYIKYVSLLLCSFSLFLFFCALLGVGFWPYGVISYVCHFLMSLISPNTFLNVCVKKVGLKNKESN